VACFAEIVPLGVNRYINITNLDTKFGVLDGRVIKNEMPKAVEGERMGRKVLPSPG